MKHLFLLSLLCLTLLPGCKKFDPDEVNNLVGKVQVIGHGGSGFQSYDNPFPTNSWRSITRAIDALNVDGVEVDLQFSVDSVWLLYHDLELQTQTECQGCIPDLVAADVQDCTYRMDFAVNGFHRESIVDLNRLLANYALSTHPPRLFLDVRTLNECGLPPDSQAMINGLISLIDHYQAREWVVVESSSIDWLQRYRNSDSLQSLMLDTGSPESDLEAAKKIDLQGLVVRNDRISKGQISTIHDQNMEVHIFGISTRQGHWEALEKHPDGLQTDNIELLQEILE